jgi:hypothetical protein
MVSDTIDRLPVKLRRLIIATHVNDVSVWPPRISRQPYRRLSDARYAVRLDTITVVYRYHKKQWVGDKTY